MDLLDATAQHHATILCRPGWPSTLNCTLTLNSVQAWILGGHDGNGTYLTSVFGYDSILNAGNSSLAQMPEPRTAFAGAILNGTIYVIGGFKSPANEEAGKRSLHCMWCIRTMQRVACVKVLRVYGGAEQACKRCWRKACMCAVECIGRVCTFNRPRPLPACIPTTHMQAHQPLCYFLCHTSSAMPSQHCKNHAFCACHRQPRAVHANLQHHG